MNLYDKFAGVPTFYYFNSDSNTPLKDHMERNLINLKVKNYKRISTSKYTNANVSEWKDLLLNRSKYKLPIATAAYSITILESLKDWYENTEEESLIISRDTIDFGLVQYFHFDWEFLMSKLPYDWDCFMMGFENINYIPFYLHQIMPAHTFNTALLNRRYVRKLIKLHCVDGKYNLSNLSANKSFGLHSGTPDYFIGHCGKTYCLPMFPSHTDFFTKTSKKYQLVKGCRLAHYDWWRNDKKRHGMEDIFTYGKPNDKGMLKKVWSYLK